MKRVMVTMLLMLFALTACATVARAADEPFKKLYLAEHLDYKKTVEAYPELERRRIGKLFQLVEDDEAMLREDLGLKEAEEPRRALRIQLDRKRVREEDFRFFTTEPLDLPVGTYAVTVRMKMIGMLGVLGTPIFVNVNGINHRAEFRGYQFDEQEEYETFTFQFDVIEPDIVTGRPTLYRKTSGFNATPDRWRRLEPALDAMHRHLRGEYTKEELEARKQQLERYRKPKVSLSMGFGQTRRVTTKGEDLPDNTIHSVTIDYVRIEAADVPPVQVREVLVLKRWMTPGQEQLFRVWLAGRSEKPETVTLNFYIEHGLDAREKIDSRQVTLQPGKYTTERLTWNTTPDQPQWGYAVVAEAVRDGQVISSARDVFIVHPNNLAVKIMGGHGTPSYANHVEVFGVTPGDCAKVILDDFEEPYKTGMSGYVTNARTQRAACMWNREIGVATMMYLFPGYTENHGARLYVRHPEWFTRRLNYSDEAYNINEEARRIIVETYEKTGKQPDMKELKTFHLEGPLSFHDQRLSDRLNAEVVRAMKEIGYTGIRWDGGPTPVYTHNVLGERNIAGRKEAMELSARRFAQMKQAVKDAGVPYFPNGYNGDTYGYGKILHSLVAEQRPASDFPQFVEMMKDGGLLMDESFAHAVGFRDPANVIHNYWLSHIQMVQGCRSVGGHFEGFPPNWRGKGLLTTTDIYWYTMTIAAGAHIPAVYPPVPWSEDGMAHFLTRYCEFVWDNKLRTLPNADKLIRLDAPQQLWYAEGAVQRKMDDRCRWVVPIVNPPPIDRFLKFRFGELPEPVEEPFEMRVRRPDGYGGTVRVFMLGWEPRTSALPLKATADDASVQFEIPELNLMRIIVIEFLK